MNDQSCRRIRGANVISALIVIMGCIHVIAFNQESGYIILSGMATMVLWSILCYVTWQGLGTETTPHKIQRAESANRAITLLFFLMFLTILFSSTTTPFPILVPAALLPLPLFVNIRALKFLRVHLKNRDCSPTPDTPKSETSRNDLNIAPHNQTEATRSYVSRHWHGEFRLPIAFWLHGGIITGLGTVTLSSIVHLLNHNVHSLRALSFVNLSALTLLAVVWVWAGVGIWRSAENYLSQRRIFVLEECRTMCRGAVDNHIYCSLFPKLSPAIKGMCTHCQWIRPLRDDSHRRINQQKFSHRKRHAQRRISRKNQTGAIRHAPG